MSNKKDINAPIRILLLGSDTEVGNALLRFSAGLEELEWVGLTEAQLLAEGAFSGFAQDDFDSVIDAISLRYALQEGDKSIQRILTDINASLTAPILMISSVRIFSGRKAVSYLETDVPDGEDAYAKTLLESEAAVLKDEKNIVLRTGWLFSGHSDDFVCRTLGLIQDGVNLAYKDNLVGCPTPVSDLSRVILTIIKQRHYGANNTGIYHYCCAEEISWVGLVEAILSTSGQLDPNANMEVESLNDALDAMEEEVPQIKRQSLSCRKVFNHYGVKQRPWRSNLRKLVKEIYQSN